MKERHFRAGLVLVLWETSRDPKYCMEVSPLESLRDVRSHWVIQASDVHLKVMFQSLEGRFFFVK